MRKTGLNILIVDDEPLNIVLLKEILKDRNYNVLESYSGKTAIEMIQKLLPDLVLLDIMMPDFSGLDVLNVMKADRNLSEIPVVIVSAKTLPDEIQQGLNAGADVYLTKPVAFTDLKQAVESVVSISEAGES